MYQNGEVWVWEGQLKAQRTVGRGREPDVVTHRCFLMQENVMTHAKDSSTRLVLPSSDSTSLCHLHTQEYILLELRGMQSAALLFPPSTAKCSAVNVPSILRNKAGMNNNKRNMSVHLCQITSLLLFLRWFWLMEKKWKIYHILLQFEYVFATTLKHHRVWAKHTQLSHTIMCMRRKNILNN